MVVKWIQQKIENKNLNRMKELFEYPIAQHLYEKSIREWEDFCLETLDAFKQKNDYENVRTIRFDMKNEVQLIEKEDTIEWKFNGGKINNFHCVLERRNLNFSITGCYQGRKFKYQGMPSYFEKLKEKMIQFHRFAWEQHPEKKKNEQYILSRIHDAEFLFELSKKKEYANFSYNIIEIQEKVDQFSYEIQHEIQRMCHKEIPTLLNFYKKEESRQKALQGFYLVNQQLKIWLESLQEQKQNQENRVADNFIELLKERYRI